MRFSALGSCLAMVALVGASEGAAKTTVLEASSPWNVNFGIDRCRLTGIFGEEDNKHLLFLEQYWPADRFGMTVSGPAFERFKSRQRTRKSSRPPRRRMTDVAFFPGQEPLPTRPLAGQARSFGPALIYSSLHPETGSEIEEPREKNGEFPQLDPALGAKIEHVSLSQTGKTVTIQTGPLGEAFKLLNQCTQTQIADWGLDPKKHLTAQRLPRLKNPRRIARRMQSNYPNSALFMGESGVMRMRVIVDETGEVTNCVIVKATETESLESPACKYMKAAEFDPALDSEGKPFKSYFATSIIYQTSR